MILATYLPLPRLQTGWQHDIGFLGKVIVPASLPFFLIGLARGLPRWAYPFGGLLFSYCGLVTYQTNLWLFLVTMLLAASMLVLAAFLTDPQPSLLPLPLRRIGQSLSVDWTRLSFAFYGATPLLIIQAFDDSYFDNRTPFFAFSVLMMVLGALVYIRSRAVPIQMTALFWGITLSILGAWLDKMYFSDGLINWVIVPSSRGADILWMLYLWLQWVFFLLLPVFLLAIKQLVNQRELN